MGDAFLHMLNDAVGLEEGSDGVGTGGREKKAEGRAGLDTSPQAKCMWKN